MLENPYHIFWRDTGAYILENTELIYEIDENSKEVILIDRTQEAYLFLDIYT